MRSSNSPGESTWAFFGLVALATSIKLSLMHGYHSTDFEVHRNWMAITSALPLKEWYFDEISIWTLDYPPFFAYFEWVLSQVAKTVDSKIIMQSSNALVSDNIVLFQRLSVIVTDCIYLYSIKRIFEVLSPAKNNQRNVQYVLCMLVLNVGLLMVDHMHFQYNGMLMGILLLTIDMALRNNYMGVAACFSILVLLKHLFLTLAPVFAIYLLRAYCYPNGAVTLTGNKRLLVLAMIAILMLTLAFGPFVLADSDNYGLVQMSQILKRLFPFGRGLVHNYWAPNVWALYYFADRMIYSIIRKYSVVIQAVLSTLRIGIHTFDVAAYADGLMTGKPSSVSGITGDVVPTLFPSISAGQCMLLVLLCLAPALVRLYQSATPLKLVQCLVFASMTSFMCGYHVHEKAVLIPVILQSLLCLSFPDEPSQQSQERQRVARGVFFVLSAAGYFGLLPLFTEQREVPIKLGLYISHLLLVLKFYYDENVEGKRTKKSRGSMVPLLMSIVLILLATYTEFLYEYIYSLQNMPFLPLMATSTLCGLFLTYGWYLTATQMSCF